MSVPEPSKILTPWAASGLKNTIPQAANPVTGNAGYDQGFPAINMTAKEAGGIPPFGRDFNGILNVITAALQFFQAGGVATYDSKFASAVGGYAKGAMVLGKDGLTQYQSQVNGNTSDPNSGGAGWLSVVASQYPVGAPIPWTTGVPPSGFLAMIGQSFSPITYPKLAIAYPNGVIPDLRACFIRGYDDGLGVDPGRQLLSLQLDEVKEHKHYIGATYAGGTGMSSLNKLQAGYERSGEAPSSQYGTTGVENLDGSAAGGPENRVRNRNFYYIVRAL